MSAGPVSAVARRSGSAHTIGEVLAESRRRLDRVDPDRAAAELLAGALLIDIRPEAQRRAHGEVPGSLVLERNVLEWRLDPASDARIAEAAYGLRVVVLCQEGYTSSPAAAALLDLGMAAATDLAGGVSAWEAAGLPMVAGGTVAGSRVASSPTEQRAPDALSRPGT